MVSKFNFSFFVFTLSLLSAQIINVVANPIDMNDLAVNGQYAKRDKLGDKVQILGNPKPAVKRADRLGGSTQNHLPKPAVKRAESMGVKGDSVGTSKSANRRADEMGGRVESMKFVKKGQQIDGSSQEHLSKPVSRKRDGDGYGGISVDHPRGKKGSKRAE